MDSEFHNAATEETLASSWGLRIPSGTRQSSHRHAAPEEARCGQYSCAVGRQDVLVLSQTEMPAMIRTPSCLGSSASSGAPDKSRRTADNAAPAGVDASVSALSTRKTPLWERWPATSPTVNWGRQDGASQRSLTRLSPTSSAVSLAHSIQAPLRRSTTHKCCTRPWDGCTLPPERATYRPKLTGTLMAGNLLHLYPRFGGIPASPDLHEKLLD